MVLRTIIFFVILYFLIKILSRFFLGSSSKQRKPSGPEIFYRVFTQQRQNRQNSQRHQNRSSNSKKQRLDDIEEAEFEEITDEEEEKQSSGKS